MTTIHHASASVYRAPASATARILIADDDPSIRQLLEMLLAKAGYAVFSAPDGAALVRMAQEHVPDLLLIDLMMPNLDGFEAIRQLRLDTRTAHLPMLVITARSRTTDLVQGFQVGADDYIAKPFDVNELLARIQANLSRAARQPVHNALTGLPGNMLLVNNLKYYLGRKMPFALLYADLDNFKVFNDTYGFARGDTAIAALARMLQEVLETHGASGDFLGHIGGDDFALLTAPERAESLCKALVARFDEEVVSLYEREDVRRSYISGLDRHGVLRRFPLMSLSIGVVSTRHRSFANYEEISQVAAEMKHVAKSRPGSSYALDMRSNHASHALSERRGALMAQVLLVSEDGTLRHVLRRVLEENSYRVIEACSALDANALLARSMHPPLLIVDTGLGSGLDELCRGRAANQPTLVIAAPGELPKLCPGGLSACLNQPFDVNELITRIDQLLDAADSS
ncbi:MAG: response regulator [Chloroflexales bacterium]|nr:response regulator [Chloroflexales bacterium]